MIGRWLRRGLTLALVVSLALTLYAGARIWADPALSPYRDAAAREIEATLDRHLADLAPTAIPDRIAARLAEDPRNWIALDALDALAQERGQTLPPDLRAAFDAARAEDAGFFANAANCAACAYDPAACALSNVFLCHAPIALTPIGDMAAITRGAIAYMAGEAVDRIDVTLAIVGLGATVTVVASGGTSLVAKAGASGLKLARNMGRLSPRLNATLARAATDGVDWMALRRAGSMDDIAASLRADAFAPVVSIAADLERVRAATDTTTALHLLPLVDDATDATRLARAAEALGPRITARAEVLGKSRLLRATVRLTDTAFALIGGLMGLILSAGVLIANALQTRLYAALRRAAIRAAADP
ncbi:hypothetical protein [Paragemmobacter ruber]|uniref:Uncharacterized protein n=1 Tax=Paragemmobacter ruber TaxID=1985673 RepID=A0ABW9Y2A6_9RHOB|nr:hypothetical protein [Rhodobacter ruber]NBE06647.1 hypothetical protein [Rhodobacter ruber]